MDNVTFRNCTIRYIDVRRQEAGVMCRLHLSADFSEPVRQALGWGDPADGIDSAKLSGELLAQHFVMTPNDKELARNYETQMACQDVGDFQFARTGGDEDGEGVVESSRFILRTAAEGAAGILEAYWRRIGEASAALKVSYTVQEQLALGEHTSHFDASNEDEKQEAEEEPDTALALASAVQMAGSTAELKRKRGRPRKVEPITEAPKVEVIREQNNGRIPSDPDTPEWRTAEEIAAGVPRFITQ